MGSDSFSRGYRILAISLYNDDAAAADRVTDILRRGGWPKANRSLIMREGLIRLEEDLAGKGAEEVFQYFSTRLAKRAAAPSTVHQARHLAYGRRND